MSHNPILPETILFLEGHENNQKYLHLEKTPDQEAMVCNIMQDFVEFKKPKVFIICAANYYDDGKFHKYQPSNIQLGYVIAGRRHGDCERVFEQIVGFPYSTTGDRLQKTSVQGFLTNTNRFVNRKEAFDIARDADQIIGPNKGTQTNDIGLTSEDLY